MPDGALVSVLRPTVDVRLQNGDLEWNVRALIDTGAPYTIFDRGAGDALGIPYRNSGERRSHDIGGGTRLAQVEAVKLTLSPFDDLSWDADADFLVDDDWNMPFGGLLGQSGFLDRWVVSFNYADRYFVVEEPSTFREHLPIDVEEEFEERDLGFKRPPPLHLRRP